MVMEYIDGGSLRKYLDNDYDKLDIGYKLSQLLTIAKALNSIHDKNLIHQDLHSGNILKDNYYSYITDLGLSRPVDEQDKGKIYGVLPYIAPEVLRGQPYTPVADIYSFGIIAYEILTGLPPYYNAPHNEFLGLKICEGLRPKFNIKLPQLLYDLIKQC